MYLKQTKSKNGRVHLAITESYRKCGKVHARTIESCGYLDELEALYTDPVEHFKARAEILTKEKKAFEEPIVIKASLGERIDKRTPDEKVSLGSLVCSRYYHVLEIDRFWSSRSARTPFDFDVNAVFRMLSYLRILEPASKKSSFESGHILADKCDFSLADTYRSLGFLPNTKKSSKRILIVLSMPCAPGISFIPTTT